MSPSTPAPVGDPTSEDSGDSAWLNAAWEVAVTVVGAVVIAAGAALGGLLWRRHDSSRRHTEGRPAWCCRPVAHDKPPAFNKNGMSNVGHAEEAS